jgi:serine/threonine protein kinase
VATTPDDDVIAGRYRLGAVIGDGGMAEVRAAEDVRLTRAVAVKLLHPNLARQDESRLRFEEEARAAARLSDPNVVAIYDTGEHEGRPFIVMELLPGRTLHDELLDGPLSEARACALAVPVLRALRAAHAKGVIHRDIKPSNILLTDSGEAKVADFGIAKVAESSDLTAQGQLVGTPSYLAPECVAGGTATVASDLYAVGVVLYEALGGRRPFTGDTPLAICHAICTDEPQPLRELRPDLGAHVTSVVARAMAKDPQQRYGSADEMLRALEPELEAVPLLAWTDEPTAPVDAVWADVDAPPTEIVGVLGPTGDVLPAGAAAVRRTWSDPTRVPIRVLLVAVALLIGFGVLFGLRQGRSPTLTGDHPAPSVTTGSSRAHRPAAPSTTRPGAAIPVTAGPPPTTAPPTTIAPAPTPTTAPVTTTSPTTTPPITTAPTTTSPPPSTAPPTTTPAAPPTTAAAARGAVRSDALGLFR